MLSTAELLWHTKKRLGGQVIQESPKKAAKKANFLFPDGLTGVLLRHSGGWALHRTPLGP